MSTVIELCNHLKKIIKLLNEEKEALIQNNGDKIIEILDSKNKLIEKLSQFSGLDIIGNEKSIGLIQEINSLQEVNLLLTKQALSYQDVLMESISQNVQNNSNTYSAKGNYEGTNEINLINKKV